MLERIVEQELVKTARRYGGMAIKMNSQSVTGMPDRLVLLPGGRLGFVELKAPGEKPRPEQLFRMERLRDMGYFADWCDTKDKAVKIVEEIRGI